MEGRKLLPINQYEEQIVDAVAKHSVVVVIGETGSGKTTQLSQILHRAGYTKKGMIGVTQPRRVAAVSVARRVAWEMDVQLGDEVGYSIRFEDRTSKNTLIKYLTDGCLLRECLFDYEFKQYSVIILDEAHERSLNTDILLGLLKRIAQNRDTELKVIITSATLDGQKFSEYFHGCPVVNVPGKLYPVQLLYSTEVPSSYLESAVETAIDVHVREPEGDILVFLTGQDEIEKVLKMLEERVLMLEEGSCLDAIILPLHASLAPEVQARVFQPAPPNCRRIIVATNVAETSLTVDGVVYVIDPGFVKQRNYNPNTGMDSLSVVRISRVQATQRAGRAGRTRPGKCYRLYPMSAFEEEFLPATVPEIQRSSLTGAVLHLKFLDLPNVDILHFDFIDPPLRESLEDALRQLFAIDAIGPDGKITALGKRIAELPLEPALGRTLLAAEDLGCLSQALTVAAMLSAETIFMQGPKKGEDRKRSREDQQLPNGNNYGDHVQYLQIYELWKKNNFDIKWCRSNNLNIRSMLFAKDVRRQLALITSRKKFEDDEAMQKIKSARSLRKALCQGYACRLAQRMPKHNGYHTVGNKSQLVQLHPATSPLQVDEDGLYPEWILYHELMASSRAFLRHVCVVEKEWVVPILEKLQNINIRSLSGLSGHESQKEKISEGEKKAIASNPIDQEARSVDVNAARARFLARKQSKSIKSSK
ncbi:probable pre-mRNA-splicing factor ATP-dependent RNA helicase DEAH4 [Physcomitrium patens]|uniref:RNA helicase n=1 Tax=Physcomitrium patens TaxID=3218 RepID=A0A7I3Z708_PHYPA|nr:probable pre-mRNA-splicing factor ATP-dependent RNA helicase DEAH4 [Physcomitrium patens]|eukprot:XP_024397142.1 probable pre-mRNA-splicing factor ATP-dependent RNA helicase DEAH4 [Physcomitrella patens]